MSSRTLQIIRNTSSDLIVQSLPDGSAAIFEAPTKNVYSLNTSAAAAWDACVSPTTLPELAAAMSRRLNAPVTEDLAHEAASELAAVGLVTMVVPDGVDTSRRTLLKQAAGVALPMVLVLTGAQQRVHAQGNGSGPIVTTQPGTTPIFPTTPPGQPASFCFVKKIMPTDVLAVGFEFELRNSSNVVVATMVTDDQGNAGPVTNLAPGQYTLIETHAPGGPYVPFQPRTITLTSGLDFCLDITNELLET